MADFLSRHPVRKGEWSLHPKVFAWVKSFFFGNPRHRFVCLQSQQKGEPFLLSQSRGQSLGVGCPGHALAVSVSLCVTLGSPPASCAPKIRSRIHQPNPCGSILVQEALVCGCSLPFSSAPCDAACQLDLLSQELILCPYLGMRHLAVRLLRPSC